MSDLTRRTFVTGSAGAAASITALGTLGVGAADAKRHHPTHSHPVVAWIGNPQDGKITVMRGDREVTIHDRALAAKLANAAK